ncbi:hypothetical protein PT974_01748 [Cladobotryum mycophilum]|uniref:Uncharacterized protein n=1 Tax=Cladobotryum mycophilum TaxID=491253 RepID=A0ABR0SWE7_9HYPO
MAIFPGGKSTRVNSPRHLTIRHARRIVATRQRQARSLLQSEAPPTTQDDTGDGTDPLPFVQTRSLLLGAAPPASLDGSGDEIDPLPPGQEQLNSFWAPGLEAGKQHRITVSQTIDAQNGEPQLVLEAEQDFFVDAPQFSLPKGTVHSTYPPSGYSDDHRILPHIVLTDPHLPWERLGSPKAGTNFDLRQKVASIAAGSGEGPVRNRVPWLAIFSFSQDELRLPPEDLNDPTSIFQTTSAGVIKPVKQSSTMTVNMSIADLWQLKDTVASPVTPDLGPDTMKDSRGDFIFVKPDLFTSLFSTFDQNGKRVVPAVPDTSQYQYLSHVRKINGSGMALAGVEDTAVFSIVIGNRSGPLDNATPTTMCVHLVSIEGVEAMTLPITSQRYVALCSLYSWNYTVLPPNTLNVPDAFDHLGSTLDVLRAPERIIAPLRSSADRIQQRVASRLDDGYTLVKYRTQTGEATVALYRGPFTPTIVPQLENLNNCSNSGVDLQILDKDLGIMDITYSVAWQVGRTMALGDEVFTAALGRLRTSIHHPAASAAKLQTLKDVNDSAIRTKTELLGDLPNMVKSLAAIHMNSTNSGNNGSGSTPPAPPDQPTFSPGGTKKRWFRPKLGNDDLPDLSLTSPSIGAKYPAAALKVARSLAQSKSGGLYNELNNPLSTDWMIVQSWLMDRMFLVGVPAHCLIPDPTYLETESLRFFRIDANWVDALLDGALSIGNHWGDDQDRVAIKQALNDYISHTPEGLNHPVQIPTYGFYLRSDLVTMFPDLRVEVLADDDAIVASGDTPPAGAPLLRHEIVTDGVMMAFMDRIPGSAQFSSLVFTQPAHQQRFAVARGLDTTQIKVDIRRQYTVDQTIRGADKNRQYPLQEIIYQPTGTQSTDNIFIWDTEPGKGLNDLRILRLPHFADVQLQTLQEKMGTYNDGVGDKPYFHDDTATSALFSMQLNDPIYSLTIDLQAHPTPARIASLASPSNAPSPEIRTLRQLGAAGVKKLTVKGRSTPSGAPPSQPKVALSTEAVTDEAPTFQRRENYTPTMAALSKNLAPHVRALRALSSDNFPAPPMSRSASGPAGPPTYDIRLGSNIVNHWDIITLGTPNLPQDLLFSILVNQDPINQYKLVELDVQIQLGTNQNNYLMNNYTGPGAIMLTNLRFNVLPSLIVDGNQSVLLLRILPRAAKGWIDATSVTELGFLLGLASLNESTNKVNQIPIQSWADYCKDSQNPDIGPDNIIRIQNEHTLVTVLNPNQT